MLVVFIYNEVINETLNLVNEYTHTYTHTHRYIYIYIYTRRLIKF